MPDADQKWIRAVLPIPWQAFGLISPEVKENSDATFVEGAIPHAAKNIAIFPREISDFGIVGLNIAPANTDDGNEIFGMIDCPYDLDPKHPVGFRIKYTQSAGVTDGVTWTLLQGVTKKDAVILDEDDSSIAVLNTVITEKDSTVANEMLITSRGIKTLIGLTRKNIEDGASIRLTLTATTVDTGQTGVALFSVLMDYVPHRCTGVGSDIDRPLHVDEVS